MPKVPAEPFPTPPLSPSRPSSLKPSAYPTVSVKPCPPQAWFKVLQHEGAFYQTHSVRMSFASRSQRACKREMWK
jgi:hypothetical protein